MTKILLWPTSPATAKEGSNKRVDDGAHFNTPEKLEDWSERFLYENETLHRPTAQHAYTPNPHSTNSLYVIIEQVNIF